MRLQKRVKIIPLKKAPECVAGVDAAFSGDTIIAVASLFTYPELVHVEDASALARTTMPYIPGLLSFREGPAIIDALQKLGRRPDVILFDGQGIAHPLGMGIASHIGVLLNIPSVGCAKSRLIGVFREPGNRKGQRSALTYKGRIVGTVLRTREGIRPLFVSPGHLIDRNDSVVVVLTCTRKYRIPEPLRAADTLSKKKSLVFRSLSHAFLQSAPE